MRMNTGPPSFYFNSRPCVRGDKIGQDVFVREDIISILAPA